MGLKEVQSSPLVRTNQCGCRRKCGNDTELGESARRAEHPWRRCRAQDRAKSRQGRAASNGLRQGLRAKSAFRSKRAARTQYQFQSFSNLRDSPGRQGTQAGTQTGLVHGDHLRDVHHGRFGQPGLSLAQLNIARRGGTGKIGRNHADNYGVDTALVEHIVLHHDVRMQITGWRAARFSQINPVHIPLTDYHASPMMRLWLARAAGVRGGSG